MVGIFHIGILLNIPKHSGNNMKQWDTLIIGYFRNTTTTRLDSINCWTYPGCDYSCSFGQIVLLEKTIPIWGLSLCARLEYWNTCCRKFSTNSAVLGPVPWERKIQPVLPVHSQVFYSKHIILSYFITKSKIGVAQSPFFRVRLINRCSISTHSLHVPGKMYQICWVSVFFSGEFPLEIQHQGTAVRRIGLPEDHLLDSPPAKIAFSWGLHNSNVTMVYGTQITN